MHECLHHVELAVGAVSVCKVEVVGDEKAHWGGSNVARVADARERPNWKVLGGKVMTARDMIGGN